MASVSFGPYRVIGTLGEGGMGIVYRARHRASGQVVALKTAKGPLSHRTAAIAREIHSLTHIRHPGVVRLLDHGVHEGVPWYSMDLLEGESLRHFTRRIWSSTRSHRERAIGSDQLVTTTEPVTGTALPCAPDPPLLQPGLRPDSLPAAGAGQLEVIVRIIRELCSTLSFLHGEGLVNCDLKPENVLVVGGAPVIIDFGLAAPHLSAGREALTVQHARAGTVPYMSPEQIRGDQADARSDLYAIGCLLYELLVGEPPFCGAPRLVIMQHMSSLPRPPSQLALGLPAALETTVLRLLEKEPSHRYGYADEVVAELRRTETSLSGHPPVHDLPVRSYLYRPRLTGRHELMVQLCAIRDRVLSSGEGAIVVLCGESGVGKTRVAMELTRFDASPRVRVVSSESAPLELESGSPISVAPLHAVRPLLRAIAERCQKGGLAVADRLLGSRRAVLAVYEPLLNAVHTSTNANLPALAPEVARKRLFEYLADTLTAFASEEPVLWILDDIGWADELSIAFLSTLGEKFFQRSPCFLLATYRSEEPHDSVDRLLRSAHVHRFELPRLSDLGVRTMVGDMLAVQEPQPALISYVVRQTEGNPFFVSECVRNAVNERLLFRDGQRTWRLSTTFDSASLHLLPRSLQELIARRLSALSSLAKRASLAAAVIGRSFESELLAAVMEISTAAVDLAVEELVRRHVVERTDSEVLRFAHDKLREASYAGAPAEQVMLLHGRVARALEARLEGALDPSKLWATLGHHFAASREAEPASRYLLVAADHARATFANLEAIALYTEAREQFSQILPDRPADALALARLEESLADVMVLVGRREEARDVLVSALVRSAGEAVSIARINRKLGKTWEAQHEHERALSFYQHAQQALEGVSMETALHIDEWIQVRIAQLWVYYWLGRLSDMERLSRELEPVIRMQSSPLNRSRFFHTQWMRTLRRDRYAVSADTLTYARGALAASQESEDFTHIMQDTFALGFVQQFARDYQSASEHLARALSMAEEGGDAVQQARSLTYLAIVSRMLGRVDETRSYAERALQVSTASGMRDYLAAALANQAWIKHREGELEAAARLAHKALDLWRVTIAYPFQWLALVPLLRIALAQRDLVTAIQCVQGLLSPTQQVLPAQVVSALASAVDRFQTDAAGSETESMLGEAVRCMEGCGHG